MLTTQLKFIDETLFAVVLTTDGTVVGHISKGLLAARNGIPVITQPRRWFVLGNEYIGFKSLEAAHDAVNEEIHLMQRRRMAYSSVCYTDGKVIAMERLNNKDTLRKHPDYRALKRQYRREQKMLRRANSRTNLSALVVEN